MIYEAFSLDIFCHYLSMEFGLAWAFIWGASLVYQPRMSSSLSISQILVLCISNKLWRFFRRTFSIDIGREGLVNRKCQPLRQQEGYSLLDVFESVM
jgi:hypothetical protein